MPKGDQLQRELEGWHQELTHLGHARHCRYAMLIAALHKQKEDFNEAAY